MRAETSASRRGSVLLRAALPPPDARQLLLDLLNEGYLVIYEDAADAGNELT